jgi:hypothetical protein
MHNAICILGNQEPTHPPLDYELSPCTFRAIRKMELAVFPFFLSAVKTTYDERFSLPTS